MMFSLLNIGEGAILASLVAVSGRSPTILGKPRAPMFDYIRLAFPDVKPNRTIMIGDR
jgi:ribonucleotide monophosphatase NagD (HAD superfamily)